MKVTPRAKEELCHVYRVEIHSLQTETDFSRLKATRLYVTKPIEERCRYVPEKPLDI